MVNDILKVSNESMLVKFADDITVSVPVTDGVDHASTEVNNILEWSKHNSMTLNLDKTMEMVVKRKVDKPIPPPVCGIEQKPGLKLLGVHLSDNPNNWDKQFKHLMQKANSRMYILSEVCKNHGYGRDDLHLIFNSLIMLLFTYGIQVWGAASHSKYTSVTLTRFKPGL